VEHHRLSDRGLHSTHDLWRGDACTHSTAVHKLVGFHVQPCHECDVNLGCSFGTRSTSQSKNESLLMQSQWQAFLSGDLFFMCFFRFQTCQHRLLAEKLENCKNWRIGAKYVIWQYCRWTTYCHTPQRWREITQQGLWLYDEPALLIFCRFTHCTKLPLALLPSSSSAPCNNYRHFLRFWDLLYVPIIWTWHWSLFPISDLT